MYLRPLTGGSFAGIVLGFISRLLRLSQVFGWLSGRLTQIPSSIRLAVLRVRIRGEFVASLCDVTAVGSETRAAGCLMGD